MTIVLRRARADESDFVAALCRRSRAAAMPYLPELHTPEDDRAYFRERVFVDCEVTVAERGGAVVAFCATRPGWVVHLYVEPGQQRSGIGNTLLRRAMQANDSLALWTFRRNAAACRFYEAHGFVATRTTEGQNDEREPDVLYAWPASRAASERMSS
jgi:GNAT superfamily N-acetyltransferase